MELLTQVLYDLPDKKEIRVWVNMDQAETVRWDGEKKTSMVHFASGRMIEVKEMLRASGWGNP